MKTQFEVMMMLMLMMLLWIANFFEADTFSCWTTVRAEFPAMTVEDGRVTAF
jgi:hypothetical protein